MSDTAQARAEAIVAPALAAMGYALVRLKLGGGKPQVLQIMVERADGSGVGIDDCAAISRAVSPILDVEDPIAGGYVLEVSTPGIERPLTRLSDFTRFAGQEAKVELVRPVDGRKRFRGRLLGVEGEAVRLEQDGTPLELPFADIATAQLVVAARPGGGNERGSGRRVGA